VGQPNEQLSVNVLAASLGLGLPQEGELLRGTIVSISGDDAYISYGGPTDAVMAADELDGLDIADKIEGIVVKTTPEVRISRKRARGKTALQALHQAFDAHLPVEGKVAGRNKGGFEVSVSGLRAFCPLSQIATGKIEAPDRYVGQHLDFLITELSADGRRIVVSRAALLKEATAAKTLETLMALTAGAEMEGTVKTLTPFGAFVDLGGVDGLLHVSEMSWHRVTDPKEIVRPGQRVRVKVLKVENEGKRISLSMKDLEADPWVHAAERYPAGSPVTGTVVSTTDFGLFVEIEPGIVGLVRNSALPSGIKRNDIAIAVGARVTGWVREVDPSRKRLSLSLRGTAPGSWDHNNPGRAGKHRDPRVKPNVRTKGAPAGHRDQGVSRVAVETKRVLPKQSAPTKARATLVETVPPELEERILIAVAEPTDVEGVESALRSKLRYRSWMVDHRIGDPCRVRVTYPAHVFVGDVAEAIIQRRIIVRFDIATFISPQEISDPTAIAFLVLFPSGAVRGISAEVEVTAQSVALTLIDALALIDPDDESFDPHDEPIVATADLIVIGALDHVSA
jgi:predicted RNA-binding protein with RPS1 domain